jgi:hypothetical protein
MSIREALAAYSDYESLCPNCKRAAKAAGKRILSNCRSGKHAKPKGVVLEGPPA